MPERRLSRNRLKLAVTRMILLRNEARKIGTHLTRVLEDIDEAHLPVIPEEMAGAPPKAENPWTKRQCSADFRRVLVISGPHRGERGVAHTPEGVDEEKVHIHVYQLARDTVTDRVFPVHEKTLDVSKEDIFVLYDHLLPGLADEVELQQRIVDEQVMVAEKLPSLGNRVVHLPDGRCFSPTEPVDIKQVRVTCLSAQLTHEAHGSQVTFGPAEKLLSDELFELDGFFLEAISKELEENTLLASCGRRWPNHFSMPPSSKRRKPSQLCIVRRKRQAKEKSPTSE